MTKLILIHLYFIVIAIFVVMAGNILADQYGTSISTTISAVVNSADNAIDDAGESVVDWNKKIME